MIISASRRTDIPAFYLDWFLNRLQEGYALVRNPVNPRSISRVDLSPGQVDGLVFWTKNPAPLLARLEALEEYPFYVQVTLTDYGPDLEPGVPNRARRVEAFQALAEQIGPGRVVWRYDPIVVSPACPPAFHQEAFEALANALAGSTTRCIISLLDLYAKIRKPMAELGVHPLAPEDAVRLARALRTTGERYGLKVTACCDPLLRDAGLEPARCIDPDLLPRRAGRRLAARRDPGQRSACTCARSVDIGTYETCIHGCRYCYATRSHDEAARRHALYDARAPMLCDAPGPEDRISGAARSPASRDQLRLL